MPRPGGDERAQLWTTRKLITGAAVLALLYVLEGWIPLFPDRKHRLQHGGRHLALAALNTLVLSLFTASLSAQVAHVWATKGWGLLNAWNLQGWPGTLLAILCLDAWMYYWHRANHTLPFLWRFHRMHHSDPGIDATTALRFHTGELLLSSLLRLGLVAMLGLRLWQVILYEVLLLPVILFHHSNVRLPETMDRWLRVVVVTPAIHQVHHSRLQMETDSNYSSIFSWWDRLAGSLRLRQDLRTIVHGLDGWDAPERQSLWGLLKTPAVHEKSHKA